MVDAWIEQTLPQVLSSLTTQQSFKSTFSALSNNATRVHFCSVQIEVQHWVDSFVSKRNCLKCSITSGEYQKVGIDHFRENKFESAIQLYSRAICFVPQIGLDKTAYQLPFAYVNRAAAYFQLGQYDNALKDIEYALTFGLDQFKPVTRLQLYKCDCLIRLGRASEAKEFLNSIQKLTDDEKDTKHWIELFDRISLDDDKKKDDSKPKASKVSLISKLTNQGLFKSNEKMSSFSTKVAVQYDEAKGRHLVAQEDIEFGDILAVSQPYITLLDSKKDVLKHCHHCYRDIYSESIRPIPCTGCSSVVYCSEECRTESGKSYHRYECDQIDLLVQLPQFARMSLRLLYLAGMDQIRSVVDSPKDGNHLSEQPEGHYSHVYQLVHHSDGPLKDLNISYEEMLKSSILACLLIQLVKKSNFQIDPKEDWKLIGGLLLRHLHQLRFNTFDYSPLNKENESTILLDLYPTFASTLNHSCRENARLKSPPNNQTACILQAARSIPAGTEITIPYLRDREPAEKEFSNEEHNQVSRMARLFENRYFGKCFCALCAYYVRNTPFGLSDAEYLAIKCSDCDHLMELTSEDKSESEVFSCTNCPLTFDNSEMKERYREIGSTRKSLCDAHKFLKTCQSKEIFVKTIKSFADKLSPWLHRDSTLLAGLLCTIGLKYLDHGEVDHWWTYTEDFLSFQDRIFGVESVCIMESLDIFRCLVIEKVGPQKMQNFKLHNNEAYERFLTRMKMLKQLRRKHYPYYRFLS